MLDGERIASDGSLWVVRISCYELESKLSNA